MYRAELLGLVTTTASKVAAATAVLGLIVAQLTFVVLMPALLRGDIGPGAGELGADLPLVDLASPAGQLGALSPFGAAGGSIGLALIAVVLLGVLAGTGEDRHGGMVGAVLASPRRGRIVIAKAAAVATGGAAVGLVLAVISVLVLVGSLALTGVAFSAEGIDVVATALRGVFAVMCLSVVGLAVGILCRSQLAGVLVMAGLLVAEPLVAFLAALLNGGTAALWTQFLPVALAQNVVQGGAATGGSPVAIGALAAMVAAFLAMAAGALRRRDV